MGREWLSLSLRVFAETFSHNPKALAWAVATTSMTPPVRHAWESSPSCAADSAPMSRAGPRWSGCWTLLMRCSPFSCLKGELSREQTVSAMLALRVGACGAFVTGRGTGE